MTVWPSCRYPHFTWTPCTAHCLDLLLEDIGKLDWVASIIKQARDLVKFVTNHQTSLAISRSYSKLELLKPGKRSCMYCWSCCHAGGCCNDICMPMQARHALQLSSYNWPGSFKCKLLSSRWWQTTNGILGWPATRHACKRRLRMWLSPLQMLASFERLRRSLRCWGNYLDMELQTSTVMLDVLTL